MSKDVACYNGQSFGEGDGMDYIQSGFYTLSDGMYYPGTEGAVIINFEDLLEVHDHTDIHRLNGCCGLDGSGGPNKLCANGHEVGTAYSDCWMPHAFVFCKDNVIQQ